MNLLSNFNWIGEKTKCLDRKLINKNYDFYTGCIYLNNEYEIGTGVVIKSNDKYHIGIIHYFYEAPDLEIADKYRIAVEFYYKPKDILPDLLLKNVSTLHSEFELLKQNKPFLSCLPIQNIKSRCTIVYGLEDETPEELLKEFYESTNDTIYVCRYSAVQTHKNKFNLTGVILNTIEISDNENDSDENATNVTKIEISRPPENSLEYTVSNIDKQNENIRIKIQRTYSKRSNSANDSSSNGDLSGNECETNDIFTISNVIGNANGLKLKVTRRRNVSSVVVKSSFPNKSQTDIKVNTDTLNRTQSSTVQTSNTIDNSENQDDDIHNLQLLNNLESSVDQPIDSNSKQTFKKIPFTEKNRLNVDGNASSTSTKQIDISDDSSDNKSLALIIHKTKTANNSILVVDTNNKKTKLAKKLIRDQTKQNRTSVASDKNNECAENEPPPLVINQTDIHETVKERSTTKRQINRFETVSELTQTHIFNSDQLKQKEIVYKENHRTKKTNIHAISTANTLLNVETNTDETSTDDSCEINILGKKNNLNSDLPKQYTNLKPQMTDDSIENQKIIESTKELIPTEPSASLIEFSRFNPVVVLNKLSSTQISRLCKMEKTAIKQQVKMDIISRKREIVREALLREINDNKVRSSIRLRQKSCAYDPVSPTLRRSTRPSSTSVYTNQTEDSDSKHSSDSQSSDEHSWSEEITTDEESTPRINNVLKYKIYEKHALGPRTPVTNFAEKQADSLRSVSPNQKTNKSPKKENISPYRQYQTPTSKQTEQNPLKRIQARAKSVSEINSSFLNYTNIENQGTTNKEIHGLSPNRRLESELKNSYKKSSFKKRQSPVKSISDINSDDLDSSTSKIIHDTQTKNNLSPKKRRFRLESKYDSSNNESSAKKTQTAVQNDSDSSDITIEQNDKINKVEKTHLQKVVSTKRLFQLSYDSETEDDELKYQLRPRTSVKYFKEITEHNTIMPTRRSSRIKSRKDKSFKKQLHEIENVEQTRYRRTSMRLKRVTLSKDSSDNEVEKPKKQLKIVSQTPVKNIPTSTQKMLKHMTSDIEEREEMVASLIRSKRIPFYKDSSDDEDETPKKQLKIVNQTPIKGIPTSKQKMLKHVTPGFEEREETITSLMRVKRVSLYKDSSDDECETPKKQLKIVNIIKTSKSTRKMLKHMTPGIIEREEAVASCSSPMQRARVGLSAHCIPTNMPCRESEYLNIYNFIVGRIKNKSSGCMYISGVPGTGKTMTVCKVMQNISDKPSCPVKFLKLNALALTEPRQIYVEIIKLLLSKTLHWEEALNEIQRFFKNKNEKRPHILLIDELDKLCNRKQDVIYNLLDLPFHSSIPLVVITIANTMDLPERILTNKVNSRLGLTRLTFKPYQFKELVDIVTARLSNAKVFKSEALELVARKVAAVSGDARRALAMCSRATEIAEEEEHDQVTMEIINKVMYEMISSSSSQAVKSCSKLEKFILSAISNEVLRTGNEEVSFVSMLENLKNICYLEKIPMPGAGVCLKLCQRLGGFRLLITQHARCDLNMTLMLNISPDDIHFALR